MGTTRSTIAIAIWVAVTVTAGCSGGNPPSAAPTSPSPTVSVGPSATASPSASASHSASASPSQTPTPRPTESDLLRPGTEGAQVLAVQQRLTDLGYWLGTPDGVYGASTAHAVTALQKAAGLGRDGVLGPRTRAALDKGVRPRARSTIGHVVEIDLDRQLLTVVDGGSVSLVLDTSTGSNAWYTAPDGHRAHATTPVGSFAVSWSVDGWHTSPLGHLYRPRYFHPRGIAVHGYTSVPPHPASHGCVRVTMAAMDLIWSEDLLPKGGTVMVY
jgi:lipoprotein-anchoring transpeptidase ErfK/SrfK